MRELQTGALWNVSSLPNAVIALAFFVPLAITEHDAGASTQRHSPFRAMLLWLLPVCLLLTKLVAAQAFKAVVATVGVTPQVWALLQRAAQLADERDLRELDPERAARRDADAEARIAAHRQ